MIAKLLSRLEKIRIHHAYVEATIAAIGQNSQNLEVVLVGISIFLHDVAVELTKSHEKLNRFLNGGGTSKKKRRSRP